MAAAFGTAEAVPLQSEKPRVVGDDSPDVAAIAVRACRTHWTGGPGLAPFETWEYDASLPGTLSPVPLRLCTCEHTVDVLEFGALEFPGLEHRATWATRR